MKLNITNKKITSLIFSILMITLIVQPVYALEITPENPVVGDEVLIRGTASPGELVRLTTIFEKRIPVIGGRYSYTFTGIRIPDRDNVFTVTSRNVKDLTVAVRLLNFWISGRLAAVNNIVTASRSNVPAGTYTIRIHGNAAPNETHVDVRISASTRITADLAGNFEFRQSTTGIPAERFKVVVGNETRTVTLNVPPPPRSPEIRVTPTAITGRLVQGTGWTNIGTLSVTSQGGKTLNWSVTEDLSWLEVTPVSGTTTTETDSVTVRATTAGLPRGTHTGTIIFTGTGVTRIVIVRLTI